MNGLNKFIVGTGLFVDNMSGMFAETWLPVGLVTAFLTLIPVVEVMTGAMMLIGIYTHFAAYAASFFFGMLIFGHVVAGDTSVVAGMLIYIFAALLLGHMPHTYLSLDYHLHPPKKGKKK